MRGVSGGIVDGEWREMADSETQRFLTRTFSVESSTAAAVRVELNLAAG